MSDEEMRKYLSETRQKEAEQWDSAAYSANKGQLAAEPAFKSVDHLLLLEKIEANTAKTAFWTGVLGVPVLVSFFIGLVYFLIQLAG